MRMNALLEKIKREIDWRKYCIGQRDFARHDRLADQPKRASEEQVVLVRDRCDLLVGRRNF